MVHDKTSVGILMAAGHHGAIHCEKYFKRGEPMPVCMVLGGDPLCFFYGGLEAPYGTFEIDVVGGLRGRPMKMVRGKVTGLPFPADAEIVLEGYVTPEKRVVEGPFGEWTGHYAGGAKPCTVLDIKAIYHRNDPILLGVPPMGGGPDEMARYRAVMRSATIKQNMANAGVPDVQQVWCHEIGGARLFHGVSIKQRYPGHAVQAGHIAAQCGASAYACKYIVVVDDDVDVTNLDHLLWAWFTRSDPEGIDPVHRGLVGFAGRPAAVAGEARQGRHDAFGRHHRRLPAVALARQVPADQHAERRGHPQGAREVRLAAGWQEGLAKHHEQRRMERVGSAFGAERNSAAVPVRPAAASRIALFRAGSGSSC